MARFALRNIKRGDTIRLALVVTRSSGPVNLTGAALTFTAKRKINDADIDAIAQKTIGAGITVTDAVNGEAVITLPPADTDAFTRDTTLQCDVQMIELDGTITTIADGTIEVTRDVTRTTA